MSGPKMVGITCDPEVIARNNERLKQVGKDNYYRGVFKNINTDIENTALWVKNYGNMTLKRLPTGYGDEAGILRKVEQLKEDYADRINEKKIDMSIINGNSAQQLNEIGVQKVKDIPKWKEQFLYDISVVFKKLQEDIEEFNAGIKQVKKENERISKESKKWLEKFNEERDNIENINIKQVHIERFLGDETSIPFMPELQDYTDPEMLPFSIEELALLEMLQSDLEEYSNIDYLTARECKLIHNIKAELKSINDTSEKAYSMKSKRAILQQMRMEYAKLDKYVSMLVAARNAEMEERSTLELEYISFCQALDVKRANYEEFSIQELRKRVP